MKNKIKQLPLNDEDVFKGLIVILYGDGPDSGSAPWSGNMLSHDSKGAPPG